MARMTNYQIAYLLSLKTHREKFPVIRWIEDNIRDGKITISGKPCTEVIEEVSVKNTEEIVYSVADGKVASLALGWAVESYFSDPANPTKEEIDLLEVCEPDKMPGLKILCFDIEEAFEKPHSCSIDYYVKDERCPGCGRRGSVNYFDGQNWSYYCGSYFQCCP